MKAIGFTGTKEGMTDDQFDTLMELLEENKKKGAVEFHHGDCVGADAQAAALAKSLGYETHVHPPKNQKLRAYSLHDVLYEAEPYLVRNKVIVRMCDLLLATPKGAEELRSGTWVTVRHARKSDTSHIIIWPDGSILTYSRVI